ncbi:HlyD family secretion protein [Catenovulum sp. SX2]|uniref:HlyD family secretion protein n=1 Tax=Catenovulum sp. SX2 TaxID=3398614 RepID=UPI003F83A780
MSTLFRSEAVEHQLDRLHGNVIVTPSIKTSLTITCILIWFVIVVAWLFTASYARKETVTGWLEPSNGVIRIYPERASGKISNIFVSEGQKVEKGDPLILLRTDTGLSSGSTLERELVTSYQRQKGYVEIRRTQIQNIFESELRGAEQQLKLAIATIEQIDKQMAIAQEKFALIERREKKYQEMLEANYVSVEQLENLNEQRLLAQSEIQGLVSSKLNQQSTISELKKRIEVLPQQHKNDIQMLNSSLADIELQMAQVNGSNEQMLFAPISGIATNIQAHIGDITQPSTSLLSLVPEGESLRVKLVMPVRTVGFVDKEQQIKIRYDAFPYQKFGVYQGRVKSVSQSVLLPNEIKDQPINVREPVYIVDAELDSSEIIAYNKKFDLKAGMTLSADIQLDERNIIEWLMEPIFTVKGKL